MKTRISLLYLLLIFGASSCIRYSFTGGSVPAEASTFSVQYFPVKAALADPSYGQTLSESLKDLLNTQTRLSLVPDEGDIQYEGAITAYQTQPVAAQGDETSARNRLTITVKVDFINRVEDGKDLSFSITQFEDFLSDENFEDVEEGLIEEINVKIIQDIFDRTLGDW